MPENIIDKSKRMVLENRKRNHEGLDQILAEYLRDSVALPSTTTVLQLMEWHAKKILALQVENSETCKEPGDRAIWDGLTRESLDRGRRALEEHSQRPAENYITETELETLKKRVPLDEGQASSL